MLVDKVNDFIRTQQLIKTGDTIVVGVSGGPDSLALLHFLKNMKDYRLNVVVAHVDHMFRGKKSKEDMDFVKHFCEEFSILFEGIQIDLPNIIASKNLNPQKAARDERYQFFKIVMEKYNADALALGHHADDQMETILMNMIRGATLSGLNGIPVTRRFGTGKIIRPFLSVTKEEIYEYCNENSLKPRIDASNEKDVYTRNRIRKEVLPFLKKENPKVHERFLYLSKVSHDDDQLLNSLADVELNNIVLRKCDQNVKVSLKKLLTVPISLQRRCIHLILKYLYSSSNIITSVHVEDILALLSNKHPSGKLTLPNGLIVEKSYDVCDFAFINESLSPYQFVITIPSVIHIHDRIEIHAKQIDNVNIDMNDKGDSVVIPLSNVKLPLIVRSRKNGDRISLVGGGSKKLKDLFIDKKIPIKERDIWPIIEDANEEILWVPYLKKSARVVLNHYQKEHIYILLTSTFKGDLGGPI